MSEDLIDIRAFFEIHKNFSELRRYQAMQENNFKAAQIYDERIKHIEYGQKLINDFIRCERK